jgi:hypothetical protein
VNQQPERIGEIAQHRLQVDGVVAPGTGGRFHARDVEELFGHVEQEARVPHQLLVHFDRLRWERAEGAIGEQVEIPEDDVQRCPEFVRDVREQFGFDPFGRVQLDELLVRAERRQGGARQGGERLRAAVAAMDAEVADEPERVLRIAEVVEEKQDLHERSCPAQAGHEGGQVRMPCGE